MVIYDKEFYPLCYRENGVWKSQLEMGQFYEVEDCIYRGKLTKLVKMIYNIPDYEEEFKRK